MPEDRGLPQLHADLVAALLTGRTDPAQPALRVPLLREPAALAEVQVVVSADTLSGAGNQPATGPGIGAIDADTARQTAEKAPMRRLVAEPTTGVLVHAAS